MATVMQLDAEQATKFWPIYKEFELELARIGDQIVTVVHDYAANYENLTPPVADQLATKILSIEQQRNELKRKYYLQVKAGLDAITAARFLQVENQLERLVDLQIAAELPVIRAR
jgi:flagellar biosynthesis chaperone FliJ